MLYQNPFQTTHKVLLKSICNMAFVKCSTLIFGSSKLFPSCLFRLFISISRQYRYKDTILIFNLTGYAHPNFHSSAAYFSLRRCSVHRRITPTKQNYGDWNEVYCFPRRFIKDGALLRPLVGCLKPLNQLNVNCMNLLDVFQLIVLFLNSWHVLWTQYISSELMLNEQM